MEFSGYVSGFLVFHSRIDNEARCRRRNSNDPIMVMLWEHERSSKKPVRRVFFSVLIMDWMRRRWREKKTRWNKLKKIEELGGSILCVPGDNQAVPRLSCAHRGGSATDDDDYDENTSRTQNEFFFSVSETHQERKRKLQQCFRPQQKEFFADNFILMEQSCRETKSRLERKSGQSFRLSLTRARFWFRFFASFLPRATNHNHDAHVKAGECGEKKWKIPESRMVWEEKLKKKKTSVVICFFSIFTPKTSYTT